MSNGLSPTDSTFLASSQFTTSIHCPCLCCHSFLWEYVVFLSGSKFVHGFHRLFMHVLPWRSNYQVRRVGIPLTGLTLPQCCAWPKAGPGFPTSYVLISFVVSEFEMRGGCSFRLYCWNCWPLLFKLSLYERRLFVLLSFVELLLTITVYTLFRWEVVVRFVKFCRIIVDHHCLNSLYMRGGCSFC